MSVAANGVVLSVYLGFMDVTYLSLHFPYLNPNPTPIQGTGPKLVLPKVCVVDISSPAERVPSWALLGMAWC